MPRCTECTTFSHHVGPTCERVVHSCAPKPMAQFWNNLKARSCYATFGCNNGSDVALKNNPSPLLIVMTYCLEVALFLGSDENA
ncbi:hypothetical protein CsSME_00046441 [Camellia sinensis var. sinensis]